MRGLLDGLYQYLLLNNISCSRAFGTIDNLESYPGAFTQGFEAIGLDCGVVHENISAAILFDEAKTL